MAQTMTYNAAAHTAHIIEVYLPFLQMALPEDFDILPIITGRMNWDDGRYFGELLDTLVDDETLFIVSTDLSHYHEYTEAVELDTACVNALAALDIIGGMQSELCGQAAALMLLEVARKQGWQGTLLDYRNSGDTAGDKNRVVGYGAIAFNAVFSDSSDVSDMSDSSDRLIARLSREEQGLLLELVRTTIKLYIKKGKTFEPDRECLPAFID
jgi:AmmeMemoRadiSam system protein B